LAAGGAHVRPCGSGLCMVVGVSTEVEVRGCGFQGAGAFIGSSSVDLVLCAW
jgi:hypothetical protein